MNVKSFKWLPKVLLPGLLFLLIISKCREKNGRDQERLNEAKEREQETAFSALRAQYEFDMLKDPATGTIPKGIFEKEILFAKTLPLKGVLTAANSRVAEVTVLNNYLPAGPNNIGGRTRAIAYDTRFDGSSNRVIITGCVSGGIMRSSDGGNNWTRVTPEGDIHNFTAIAQDSRTGFQDTWYAGGGEPYGNTASENGATYLGYGIWKSANNGITWTKLQPNVTDINGSIIPTGTLETFDHPFDFVHKIAISPASGDVYIAGSRRLLRSRDGGNSFQTVFGSTLGNSLTGQMDVAISDAGRVLLALNGANPDLTLRGVWVSGTGNAGSFSRIAGGQILGIDSVANWRANSYNGISKRILLALAPSNQNVAYVYYENGLSSDAPNFNPEADLFRVDISGNTFTWSNRSANLPDFSGGNLALSDPLSVQAGYDMLVKVKPNDANTVLISGTNLYRSTDGFATRGNTEWINGYNNNFTYSTYPNGHADVHTLAFNPSNNNQAICGDDGGIRITNDVSVTPVTWSNLPNYQTLQYYYVAIDPDAGRNNFAGGSQDNGVMLRDKVKVLNTASQDSNNHIRLNGGDGSAVSISRFNPSDETQYVYGGSQFGTIYRERIAPSRNDENIRPNNLTTSEIGAVDRYGEFVTNFRLNTDNTEDLYYVNFNRLFRTSSASTVTSSAWTELTGVAQAVNPANPASGRTISIRALAFSRGTYATAHCLFIGTTDGKILRLNDPRNSAPGTVPVNITPAGLQGNVQDIAVSPVDDNEVMAVVSNYNTVSIWWTNNAKAASPTWKNAEGDLTLPSVRSCAIVARKDTVGVITMEYYVGTSVGLYSTTNLANTNSPVWQREGGNLLNFAVVQSLAYRPSDNLLLAGTHGNGMYYSYIGRLGSTDPANAGKFIVRASPTVTRASLIYKTGDLTVQKIVVRLFNMKGQLLFREERAYEDATVSLRPYAPGMYILSIMSDDGQHRFTQKVVKQ
jgi:hypothetical protein